MNFQDAIKSDRVVLVEFYASWCPHCQRMMPIVDEVKELLEGRVPVYQYDIDTHNRSSEIARVKSIPTFLIYVDGTEAWRHTGEIDGEMLLSKVESFI